MQKTTALGSREVRLISTFMMVFPNFSVQILVSSEMLSANRKNHVVYEVALLKKVLVFWTLMLRIGTILCAKVVHRIAVVSNFPALWLIFVVFPTSS